MKLTRPIRGTIVACLFVAFNGGCGHAGNANRPTVGVIPFDAVGIPSETAALRRYATQLNRRMEEALAGDSAIRVLPTDPNERPRNPETQLLEGLRYLVGGSVARNSEGTLVLSWRLVAVEDGMIVDAGNVFMVSGSEADSIVAIGRKITSRLLATRDDPK